MSELNNKKYLDEVGLAALWARITDYGAPRWTAYKPTTISADATKVVIKHESAATAAQKADSKGVDIAVELPAATQDKAGVMTAADKTKLDNMNSTAEDAVTIKQVQVKNQSLKIDGDKYVDWDFVYNSTTDTLDIIDCNDSNKVLTSVTINSFIGDALLKGILTDSDIVPEDGDGNSGTFIKLTFTTTTNDNTTESKDVYINVADLIDFYTAGSGISIENGAIDHNETQRSSTITLKIATSTERGGFVAHKVSTTATAVTPTTIEKRYFGVEIGKDDKAIVNVPIGSITKQDNSISGEVTLSPVTGGSTNLITGLNIVENTDKTGHNINLIGTSVKVGKETDWSVTGTGGGDGTTLKFGDSFTVFKDIVSDGTNGHGTTKSNTTWTLPQPSRKAPDTATAATSQTIVADNSGSKFEFTAVTDIAVNGTTGEIQPVTTKFTAQVDVISIPTADIEALQYPAQ